MKAHRLMRLFVLLLAALLLLPACDGGKKTESGSAGSSGTDTAAPDATDTETGKEETSATDEETHTEAEEVLYYVMTEWREDETPLSGPLTDLAEATALAQENKQYGYRVFDDKGNTVFLPYTELQCDILREAKRVTDYCREKNFTYGDAPVNPAINHRAKKVSCDRLVCWVLYNLGYTDQPRTQGVTVWAIADFCEKYGFEKITNVRDLQPGDVVLVNPDSKGRPGHTFLCGSERERGKYFRYDCGSDERIRSVQPFNEGIQNFVCAYRPNPDTRTDQRVSIADEKKK